MVRLSAPRDGIKYTKATRKTVAREIQVERAVVASYLTVGVRSLSSISQA